MSLIASLVCLPAFTFAAASVSQQKTPSEWIVALRSRSLAERQAAEKALVAAGLPAVEPLIREATEYRLNIAVQSIAAKIGPVAVPTLLKLLEDPQVSGNASRALYQAVRPNDPVVMKKLWACLAKPSTQASCGQAFVRASGPACAKHLALLRGGLRHEDVGVRLFSAAALGQIGAAARPAAPELVKALAASQPPLRMAAATALGKIRDQAPETTAALKKAATDEDNDVRQAAEEALKNVR